MKRYSTPIKLLFVLLISGFFIPIAMGQEETNKTPRQANIVVYGSASQNAYAQEGYPTTAGGVAQRNLYVGYDSLYGKKRTRTYIQFNLPSVPAGATITSVKIELGQYLAEAGGNYGVTAYRITNGWNPYATTWNSQPGKAEVAGTATFSNVDGVKTLDITALGKEWYSGAKPNYGITIWANNEVAGGGIFCSLAGGASQCQNQPNPRIRVEYQPPSYNITGQIVDSQGSPVSGVTVSDGTRTANTDASGNYTITGVPNGTYTVTPIQSGRTFFPASRAVTIASAHVTGQDFVREDLTIAGQVTYGGSPLSGVTISDGTSSVTTDASGNYLLSVLNPGSYTITASKGCYQFAPPSLTVNVTSNETGQNFTASGACSISGQITSGGSPVSGLTVSDGAGHTATTDANGNYTIGGLRPGSYSVTPSGTCYGFTPSVRPITLSSASVSSQSFTASGACTLSGQITTNDGTPLKGVTVSDNQGHTATSDDNGTYTLNGLKSGTHVLTPNLDCATFVPSQESVVVSGNITNKNFVASGACSIFGQITENSNPLKDVAVSTDTGLTATTDASGNYTINGLLPGTYKVIPTLTGKRFTPASRSVDVVASNVTGQNFQAEDCPCYTISGQVKDSSGNPISGVKISDGANHTTTTDSDGNYILGSLTLGNYTLSASKDGWNFTPSSLTVNIATDNITGQDFTGTLITYSVSGKVTDITDPNNHVALAGVTLSSGTGFSTTTDSTGNYTLSDLPAGYYTITPSYTEYTCYPTSQSVVLVSSDKVGVDFQCFQNQYTISGQITDKTTNSPIRDVIVSDGAGHSAQTDSNGNYTLNNLPAGNYTLSFSKDCYSFTPDSPVVKVGPDATQNITGEGSCSIAGKVTDGSKPLSGITIADNKGHSTTTDAQGNYSLTGLTSGSYTLTPKTTCYTFSPASLTATLPPDATGQDFVATSSCSISGKVVDNDNTPIEGVTISTNGGHSAKTDATGNYSLTGLTAGNYTVTPNKGNYIFSPVSLSAIVPPSVTQKDFVATPVYSITGRVTDESGNPLSGASITTNIGGYTATSDPDGYYVISEVISGTYNLNATKKGYAFSPINDVSVPPEATNKNFEATTLYSISGTVTDINNQPVKDVAITVLGRADFFDTTTNDSGYYLVENLFPGRYYVRTPSDSDLDLKPIIRVVTLPPNAENQDFSVIPRYGSLTGRVTAQGGGAISGARVSFAGKVVNTDSNGNYTIADISPGVHTIRVSANNHLNYKNPNIKIVVNQTTTHNVVMRPVRPDGYRLPWQAGHSNYVSQGNGGGFSHRWGTTSQYAYDFARGGSNIVASRAGKVIGLETRRTRSCYSGGCSYWCRNYGSNYVRILHSDNTSSLYVHLKHNTIRVGMNDRVQAGQVIGQMGTTGCSTGVHLHFQRNYPSYRYNSIKTSFLDVSSNGGIPVYGRWYTSDNQRRVAEALNFGETVGPMQDSPDTEPPWGDVEFRLTGETTNTLQLNAFDYDSDTIQMRIASSENELEFAEWQPFTNTKTVDWLLREAFVEFKDGVGNSVVYSDTIEATSYEEVEPLFTIQSGCTNQALDLTNQTAPYCEQCGWKWDLGDGITSELSEPQNEFISEYPAFTFEKPGIHTVTLSVANVDTVKVFTQQVESLLSPSPEFTVTRLDEDTVFVEAKETQAASWEWIFGDGTTLTGRSATHTFTDTKLIDEQPVQLFVQSANGCESFDYQFAQQKSNDVYLPLIAKTTSAIKNGDFENGATSWTEFSKEGGAIIVSTDNGLPNGFTPHSGKWAAWLGGVRNNITYIEQDISVPSSQPYLSYWEWIASEDSCGGDFAGIVVNGSNVVEQYNLCASSNTQNWSQRIIDLSSYAGQDIKLQIRVETNSTLNSNLFIDDITFQANNSTRNKNGQINTGVENLAIFEKNVGEVQQDTSSQTASERLFGQ